jgi:ubiquinone/menaquinone biosynthesis C-methylase UbiE/uncharacterized protein YbaR (Trm112 family)
VTDISTSISLEDQAIAQDSPNGRTNLTEPGFAFESLLVCPDCHGHLTVADPIICDGCGGHFPVVGQIPVLLPADSVFSKAEFATSRGTFYEGKVRENATKQMLRKKLPSLTRGWQRDQMTARVHSLLGDRTTKALGLQIGAGEDPQHVSRLFPNVEWVHTDVDFAYRPHVIADATGLPLPDNSVDIVYADQVLEHVFDLHKAASEIQRVLKTGGLVVIGIPFIYPWHGVPYDFTRLTPSGIRALFRCTEMLFLEMESGPWAALGVQLDNRMINLFSQRQLRWAAVVMSRFLFSGLKYVDRFATSSRYLGSAASLTYVGRKLSEQLTAAQIMNELRDSYGALK